MDITSFHRWQSCDRVCWESHLWLSTWTRRIGEPKRSPSKHDNVLVWKLFAIRNDDVVDLGWKLVREILKPCLRTNGSMIPTMKEERRERRRTNKQGANLSSIRLKSSLTFPWKSISIWAWCGDTFSSFSLMSHSVSCLKRESWRLLVFIFSKGKNPGKGETFRTSNAS